jgi:uncharacterized protein with von Willebrand factor type A (vWA) domain
MDCRYSRFDAARRTRAELLKRLEELFHQLLLMTSGNVDRALQLLDAIARRHGLYPPGFGIADFKKHLDGSRQVERRPGGGLRLAPRGEQRLRSSALESIFSSLRKDSAGEHRVAAAGEGTERLPETRPYQFGDPVHLLDGISTVANAIRRGGAEAIEVGEEDLEVYETEHSSSCATVLMVDVSHSMILYGEDRITPAKRVAIALCELIQSRYPKDSVNVVLFGDRAWEVPRARLPYIAVGPFHTNTRAGLQLAQQILARKKQVNRQIFMITDGKPSALTEPDGGIYKNPFGLDPRVVNKTLDEAVQCRRLGIPISTFMLTDDPTLVEFIDRFTRTNRGRAYYSRADRLGDFVLVDYIRNRKRRGR